MQIIVLGMHRSGTSAVTRLINLMGASIGPARLLLPESPDNPKGFWERQDVSTLNTTLLNACYCVWFKVDTFDAVLCKSQLPQEVWQRMEALIREFDLHQPWVVKNPRMCITLPCWLPLLKAPVAVIVSRDPRAVARSLERRNAIPPEYGIALWEFHAASVIRHAASLPKIFVSYESLLAAPMQAATQLYESLRAIDARHISLPSEKTVADFIDPALNRAQQDLSDLALTPHQQILLAMLRGKTPFDSSVAVSHESRQIMETQGFTLQPT